MRDLTAVCPHKAQQCVTPQLWSLCPSSCFFSSLQMGITAAEMQLWSLRPDLKLQNKNKVELKVSYQQSDTPNNAFNACHFKQWVYFKNTYIRHFQCIWPLTQKNTTWYCNDIVFKKEGFFFNLILKSQQVQKKTAQLLTSWEKLRLSSLLFLYCTC